MHNGVEKAIMGIWKWLEPKMHRIYGFDEISTGGISMRKLALLSAMLLLGFSNLASEEYIINSKGQRILLKDDNTWSIVENTASSNMAFRKSNWGMSKDEVLGIESGVPKYKSDTVLVYADKVAGFPTDVLYIFAKDKLVRAKYLFTQEHSNKTEFISDFNKIKTSLRDKYRDPKNDRQIWKNDLYKSEPTEWGMAIAVGHLNYYTLWGNPETSIFLYLDGENFEITLGIEYSSIVLGDLEKQVEAEDNAGKF